MLERALTEEGYRVVTAGSAEEALSRMRRRRPDLVLVDLLMPQVDGMAFLREVRRNPLFHGQPVVVITARDLSEKDGLLLEQGVRAMLPKGEDLGRQLAQTLTEILQDSSEDTPSSP